MRKLANPRESFPVTTDINFLYDKARHAMIFHEMALSRSCPGRDASGISLHVSQFC
ncbi:MAG: hypothetical protein LBU69_04785 [Deltaproteobacteria bacterium]|nr:hypothetical protein [Deltaproteobacteria bacterium]